MTSKLDPLIEGSTMLAVSQARVGVLSVQLTPWSWPNLLVIVSEFSCYSVSEVCFASNYYFYSLSFFSINCLF